MVSKRHMLPAKDRKVDHKAASKFRKGEEILADIYADHANGLTRSEIKSKLLNGLYQAQQGKGVKDAMACAYLRAVDERIRQDFDNSRGEMAHKIALNYYNIYQDAMENGDRLNANKALDGLAKLVGLGQPNTAILINNTQSGLTVNFGFINKQDEQ